MAYLFWLANCYRMLEEQYLVEQREKIEKEKLQNQIASTNQEAETPKQKENKSRQEIIMCSYAQLEKIVEYMEQNGDLSKLTYKGGTQGDRMIADAGWKELTAIINETFRVEKNYLQLRRNWGDFKNKVRKKSLKLQQFKELSVGRPPFPLSDLELRVLALKDTDEDQASTISGSPVNEANERSPVLKTPENVVKAKHNLELPLPPRPIYVKKEEKLIRLPNSPNGNNTATTSKISYIKISPKSPQEPITLSVPNNFPIQTSSKPEEKTSDALKALKANIAGNDDTDLEHMAMEREFLHLTHIYEQSTKYDQNQNKKTNDNKTNQPTEASQKPNQPLIAVRKFETKTDKTPVHPTKRHCTTNVKYNDKENQNPETQNPKKIKLSTTENVVSLFLDNLKEQRLVEMKREEKRMELEDKRLENEREALRQRDVQLAQNAQILNVVVQLAELTERVLNKRNE